MKNPFTYSGIAKDSAFCNRKTEQSDLNKHIINSENILLYSHRRLGKTSLLFKIMGNLNNITAVYVDLYGTTSVNDFITAVFKGISKTESKLEKLLKLFRERISTLSFAISLDQNTGLPTITPLAIPKDNSSSVDEVLSLLESMSKKKKLVVIFDEFQEISRYEAGYFEKQLRKSIQFHDRISYVYCGSQRHLLLAMFNDSDRAFYKQALTYTLKKISDEDYIKWINELYDKAKKSIDNELILNVIHRCQNHPMYVQEFFYHLWSFKNLRISRIDEIEKSILTNREAEFISAWESFTLNQKKALKLLQATDGKNIYASHILAKYGFNSASQNKKALEVLENKGFVLKNGNYYFQDIFFSHWISSF